MASTTYDINVRYKLQDNTSAPAEKIGKEYEKTAKKAGFLKKAMMGVAAVAAAGLSFRAASKFLIGYNSNLEDTKNAMSGLLQMNLGGTFATNQAKANKLVEQFKGDAKASAGTMQDMTEFAKMVVNPVLRAGAGMRDLRDITKGGVVAAKAFGIEAGMAALDIEQALAGTLTKKDRFARALLEPMGYTTEAWNAMVKETPKKAADALVAAFNQPAIKNMAEAYKKSWSGVTSTLKDNLQQALGKVGLPLMKAIGKEVQAMNAYFEKHPEKVQAFIQSASDTLTKLFSVIKGTVKFLANNASTLIAIAKAYAGFKIVGGIAGMASSAGGMGANFLAAGAGTSASSRELLTFKDRIRLAGGGAKGFGKVVKGSIGSVSKFGTAMVSTIGKFNLVALGLGAVYVAATKFADWVDSNQDEEIERVGKRSQFLLSGSEDAGTKRFIQSAVQNEIIKSSSGDIDMRAFMESVTGERVSSMDMEMNQRIADAQAMMPFSNASDDPNVRLIQSFENADIRAVSAYEDLVKAMKEDHATKSAQFDKYFGQYWQAINYNGGIMRMMMGKSDAFRMGDDEGFRIGDPESTWDGKDQGRGPRKTKKNGDVKVYINTIKVVGDDPDRFAMRIKGAFRSGNTKAVSSRIRGPGNEAR